MLTAAALLLAGVAEIAATPPPVASTPLKIIAIDVEGGAATLYITPQGHSMLVDTGWPAGIGGPRAVPGQPAPPPTPSSAERIVAVARANGLTRIDHLVISHYHIDHVGGFAELLTRMPVGEIIDHGPNRELKSVGGREIWPQTLYPQYLEAARSLPRRTLMAGDTLRIDDLVVTVVNADRVLIDRRLPGAGGAGTGCDVPDTNGDFMEEENPRSLGFVATWGRARVLALADTTWDVEQQLVCPRDRIGPVDLMFADNHGSDNSNSRPLLATARPRVVVVENGATKGARPNSMRKLATWPGYAGVWQLHGATRNEPADNTAADQIANPADVPDAMHPLEMLVARDGTITVRNPRTGVAKSYPPGSPRRAS